MTQDKTKLEKLKDLGLLGSIKVHCHITGCKNLETTCVDCGRLVSTAEGVSGWISVKDRTPTEEEKTLPNRILVYFPEMDFIGMHGNHISYSYWMPLPPPPKDE